MSKRDKSLITVTIVLLVVLIFSFVWDINKFVLDRTLNFEVTEDMQLDNMRKYGLMFYRKAYEAKFEVKSENAEKVLNGIASEIGVSPVVMPYSDFLKYSEEVFNKEVYKPNPMTGTEVVIIKSQNKVGCSFFAYSGNTGNIIGGITHQRF